MAGEWGKRVKIIELAEMAGRQNWVGCRRRGTSFFTQRFARMGVEV